MRRKGKPCLGRKKTLVLAEKEKRESRALGAKKVSHRVVCNSNNIRDRKGKADYPQRGGDLLQEKFVSTKDGRTVEK